MKKTLIALSISIISAVVLVGSPDATKKAYGKTADGKAVSEYTLTNDNGMVAKIIDYGAIVTELWAPDRNGKMADIVLGYDNLEDYIAVTPYFGAIVGRYGNRIAEGVFEIDGTSYELATNNDANHLHGGIVGFDKVVWKSEAYSNKDAAGVKLSYLSKDGEEGYPGNLMVTVIYVLTNANELIVKYEATTDKPTVVNLTHHGYWNLRGQGNGSILDHELTLNAPFFTPVDSGLIPTGELIAVAGTAMDFTRPKPIGSRIDANCEQLKFGGGYDHNWVLDKTGGGLTFAARLYDPDSGRQMEIFTEEPGIQFYSGNFLDGTIVGKGDKTYHYRYGMCLETQHFPDSPNKGHFPTTRLNPGQVYKTKTVHKFSAQ